MWRSARATTRGAVWGGVERTPTARWMSMSAVRGRVRAFMAPARWMSMSAVFRVTARLGTRRAPANSPTSMGVTADAPASADYLDAAVALASAADNEGNTVVFECGKLAQLADGSATVQVCLCVCVCVYSQYHQIPPCWVCVRACVRACVHECVRACVCVCILAFNRWETPRSRDLVMLGTAMQKKNQSCFLTHGESSCCRGETALQKKKPKKNCILILWCWNRCVKKLKKKMAAFFVCVYKM